MSQEYKVRVSIEAWIPVKADSIDEAKGKANEYIGDYDFGRLSDIDWDVIQIVDENGGKHYA